MLQSLAFCEPKDILLLHRAKEVSVVHVEESLFFSELMINISQGNKQLKLLCYFQRLPGAIEILISLAIIRNTRTAILSVHARL